MEIDEVPMGDYDSDESELIEPTLVISEIPSSPKTMPLDSVAFKQVLTQLQHSGERNLDFFSLLLHSRRSCETKLLIPVTLAKLDALPAVLLFTNGKGVIEKSFEANFGSFWPVFVFTEANSRRFCYSEREAIHCWTKTPTRFGILQAFVQPKGRKTRKLLVHWKRELPSRVLAQTQALVSKAKPPQRWHTSQTGIKKPHRKFSCARQLRKTSFSPWLPYKPLLNEQSSDCSNGPASLGSTTLNVETTDEQSSSLSKELDEAMHELVLTLDFLQPTHDHRNLVELIAEFVEDEEGRFIFLKCKGALKEVVCSKSRFNLSSVSDLPSRLLTSSRSSIGNSNFLTIQNRFNDLERAYSHLITQKRSLNPLSPSNTLGFFPKLSTTPQPTVLKTDPAVAECTKRFDELRRRAAVRKALLTTDTRRDAKHVMLTILQQVETCSALKDYACEIVRARKQLAAIDSRTWPGLLSAVELKLPRSLLGAFVSKIEDHWAEPATIELITHYIFS